MSEDATGRLSKATLFCPECGHRSGPDGDWRRTRCGRSVHYFCPDCHTEITVRSTEPTAREFWTTWTDTVQTWRSEWLDSLLHS
jgi:predicted RNA-binding Zn-ribbon protein involved in translation (DUF1610 family)